MPPSCSASSKALVAIRPSHLSRTGTAADRAEGVLRPTTSRALVLRNGKYGTMGTGELVSLRRKLTGKEKLDLLAEDKVRRAILPPFRLEQCLDIASSQYHAHLDNITNMKDPALFCDIINAELDARAPLDQQQKLGALQDPSYIASIIATRIHNVYMLAAGWRIVRDTLIEFAVSGLADDNVKTKLKNNHQFTRRYLTLYDMVGILVHLSQSQTSVLATTTPHYAQYFRKVEDSAPDEPDVQFDWNELRDACLSFMDSIIVELCFPRPSYPRDILFSLLRDAAEEAPKETKRFPQLLWDAIGDFSTSVELHSLLEAGLLGPDEKRWKDTPRVELAGYEQWLDAHYQSDNASSVYRNWKDLIYPLENAKEQSVLDEMWRLVDSNYRNASGKGIDGLWNLTEELDVVPQWHAFYVQKSSRALNSDNEVSEEGMPGLIASSESSDNEDSSDGGFRDDESGYDETSYDADEEEEFHGLLRATMEKVHDSARLDTSSNPLVRKDGDTDNPFMKVFESLRGRLFSSNPKFKVERNEAKKPENKELDTFDDVEEGKEETLQTPKKKKKKKPKKNAVSDQASLPIVNEAQESPQVSPSAPTRTPSSGKRPNTASLSLPVEPTIAQSARSYIKAERLGIQKNKIKSRSDQASIFSNGSKDDKGMFAKFRLEGVKETSEEEQRKAKQSWFSKLSRRATSCMHQLLRTAQDEKQGIAPMKWDHFVALMVEMGFTYDPATAGSSVRFVPPDKRDKPITVHKPHPNPTLQPIKLREISSRLKRYYGWNKEDFLAQAR